MLRQRKKGKVDPRSPIASRLIPTIETLREGEKNDKVNPRSPVASKLGVGAGLGRVRSPRRVVFGWNFMGFLK